MKKIAINPFTVANTPDQLGARDVVDLFVDVFSDFEKVPSSSHTFIHGARGTGKSMMLRYLEPDCQIIAKNNTFKELDFWGILIPIKTAWLSVTELFRLEGNNAPVIFNEHFLVSYITIKIFESLNNKDLKIDLNEENISHIKSLSEKFAVLVKRCGGKNSNLLPDKEATIENLLNDAQEIYSDTNNYVKSLAFSKEAVPYNGVLLGYNEFLIPLARALKALPFTPKGSIYLMFDDADNLSLTQTKILNSWVHSRSTANITLKISTQLRYKTYHTTNNMRIDSPHDYSEVNISSIYTNDRDKYYKRIEEITRKRLKKNSITTTPEEFFPEDEKQEKVIQNIAEKLREEWNKGLGRGFRASDDVTRYARPDYIKSLKGTSKSGSTYSYAGFKQLVHISSGIIRWFLEPAHHMFAEQLARNPDKDIKFISPNIQNTVIKDRSALFLSEIDKISKDESHTDEEIEKYRKLRNLIDSLGGVFHEILLSNRSERKVFSIALQQQPTKNIEAILDLGEECGYFHKAYIGNKDGTGRTKRYILNRLLAPHYLLDPTSFAGYLFITNQSLEAAMHNPDKLLRRIKNGNIEKILEEENQGDLFDKFGT